MKTKDKNLQVAKALLAKSKIDREKTSRFKLATGLYNAASAFSFWQLSSSSGDLGMAMEFAQNLEDAADAFSRRSMS